MISNDDFKLERNTENFLSRITQALNRPIQSRCAELAVLFDRGSMKEFQTIFPLLIDNIFGPHGTVCWELRSITSTTNQQDFQALQHFLSPLGPMFKLIYSLLRDLQLKFEFSLSYLPNKVRQSLDGAAMHPFYADLLHIDHQTNRIISLMLNPFDYYFFHFAYHLINPFHQRGFLPACATWSTVYYVLCCDYVLHFLPSTSNSFILPILSFYNGKNPIYILPSFNKPSKVSRLFRSEMLNVNKSQTLEHHPRNEIWRSETIMTIFIDMWLSNDQVINSYQNFNILAHKQHLQLNELPTGEYIRIIRVLIKQLHAFSASTKVDASHMGELKKIVIPYLQGKMYTFLRHLTHRWPLDGSFRLVLELWVSFIQPWRYPGIEYTTGIRNKDINPDVEDINIAPMKAVDREHLQFMAENLLAYTVLLQQLIPRFTKVDLSSPKLALILYRLTKVFAQPNLVGYLREIESCAENISNSPLHSYSSTHSLPPLSPTSKWSTNSVHNFHATSYTGDVQNSGWSHQTNLNGSSYETPRKPTGKWDNVIKQKILELEGSNFCYKPIFYNAPASEVYDLIYHIQNAEKVANLVVQSRIDQMKQQAKGPFGFIKSLFSVTDYSNDEFSLDERRKVPTYLHHSLCNLMEIFGLSENSVIDNIHQSQMVDESTSTTLQNNLDHLLTPERMRKRAKTIKYEGDPDLHPITSYEIKVLVRMLYQIASKINQNYGPQINILYHKENFLGRLSRQFLQAPLTIYKYEKSFSGSPRLPQHLPVRLSLRYFANQKVMFYLVLAVILSKLCGYGYVTFVCIYAMCWFIYNCFKSFWTERSENLNSNNTLDSDDNSLGVHNFSSSF